MRTSLLISIAFLLIACDEPPPKPTGEEPNFRNSLHSFEEFHQLSEKSAVKYLINMTPGEAPLYDVCYFINTTRFPLHYDFLQSFEEYENLEFQTYSAWVLSPTGRRFFGSALRDWPNVVHPESRTTGIVSFGIYSSNAGLSFDDVSAVFKQLRACAPFAGELLVFVPDGTDQLVWLRENENVLEDAGIPYLYPNALITEAYVVHSAGEGYGTLRIVPEGHPLDEYGPKDVVVVASPPADISLVQGLITRDLQNDLSHTNLRLLEKEIPNVSMPAVYQDDEIIELADTLIHFEARDDALTIEPATLADAEAFWESRRITLPDIVSDLNVVDLRGFDEMDHAASIAFGTKAGNLGELYDILPEENRAPGFGIPFSAYVSHVESTGAATLIETFLEDPRTKTDAAFKRDALKTIRDAIKDGEFSPELLDAVEAAAVENLGSGYATKRIRFRSSTNVEDLDEISGAGLYDSKSGCFSDDRDMDENGPSHCLSTEEAQDLQERLAQVKADLAANPEKTYLEDVVDDMEGDLSNEKPVARAIKKVWASLWNERAFDERDYYGIDHRKAFMGIAVNESFVLERRNAVALTELEVDDDRPLYRLNSQVGFESVVRPTDPTVTAETLTYRRAESRPYVDEMQILVYSSFNRGRQLWGPTQLEEIANLLFIAHQHFSQNVYSDIDRFSLDVEIKLTADNRIVLKQARPFVSFGALQ